MTARHHRSAADFIADRHRARIRFAFGEPYDQVVRIPGDAKRHAAITAAVERHNGTNNGEIAYSVRDAKEVGIGRTDASLALVELVGHGFLRVGRNSAFNMKSKQARTWTLTAEPSNGDGHPTTPTKDFITWSPPPEQSGPPDRERENEIILLTSVRRAGPSGRLSTAVQSGGPDTYNIPCVQAKARGGVTAQERDPAARAERAILDDDEDLSGGPKLLAEVIAAMAAR